MCDFEITCIYSYIALPKKIRQFLLIIHLKFPLSLYSLWFIVFTHPSLLPYVPCNWVCSSLGAVRPGAEIATVSDAPCPSAPWCCSHHLSTRGCMLPGYTPLMWSQRIAPVVWLLSLEKWLNSMAWQRMKSCSRALWNCSELLDWIPSTCEGYTLKYFFKCIFFRKYVGTTTNTLLAEENLLYVEFAVNKKHMFDLDLCQDVALLTWMMLMMIT